MSIGTVIYGPRYVGKTSFLKAVPDAYHISTSDWEEFQSIGDDTKLCDAITVDNIHRLLESCTSYVCEQENEEHPQLAGNRKSIIYKKIKEEMKEVLFALADKCESIFFTVAMDKAQLNSSLYQGTYFYPKFDWVLEDIMPHITDQTIAMMPTYKSVKRKNKNTGDVDYVRKEKRIMICSPRADVYAGDSTGNLPNEFDAGNSGAEAFAIYSKYMTKD